MTTKEIQKAIAKMQVLKFHPIVCENIIPLYKWEMDVMSISKSSMMYEFEVKVSRGDFKADFKKRKGDYDGTVLCPNYFSYVCPLNLISLDEINLKYGLYYIDNEQIIEIRKPKILHCGIHNKQKILEKVLRLHQERMYLGCARMTYNNKNKFV